jgi:2'-5' RNA ligase
MHRLFFAIEPDAPARAALAAHVAALRTAHGGGGWVAPEKWHATLAFLGEWPAFPGDIAARAARAAGRVDAAPFPVVFDRLSSFAGGRRPWVLLASDDRDFAALARSLHAALDGEGVPRDARPFVAHLTVRRAPDAAPAAALAPVQWTVREVALLHSDPARAQYATLGRWPLAA